MQAEVWREFEKKLIQWQKMHGKREEFANRKARGEFEPFIQKAVRSSKEIGEALRLAGAPQRFADLNNPVSSSRAISAIRYSHLIRKRFTLGDLLDQSGWLKDTTAAQMLDEP